MLAQAQEHSDRAAVYRPRNPHDAPLWHVLQRHYVDFAVDYEERFAKEYGFLRNVVGDVIGAYLKCGDLKEGFARVRCPNCHHEYLPAFSCRGCWFCPSRHAKKVVLLKDASGEARNSLARRKEPILSLHVILSKIHDAPYCVFLINDIFSHGKT